MGWQSPWCVTCAPASTGRKVLQTKIRPAMRRGGLKPRPKKALSRGRANLPADTPDPSKIFPRRRYTRAAGGIARQI